MRNKLVATALVLGFSFAPLSAFATDLTTVQGGTPVYSCPQGTEKFGENCITPAYTEHQSARTVDANLVSSESVIHPGGTYVCTGGWWCLYLELSDGTRLQQGQDVPLNGRTPVRCHDDAMYWPCNGNDYTISTVNTYDCPNGATLSGTSCIYAEVNTPHPASTTPATVSGSNGGSLIASVSGFLSPVWDFIQIKLLPAIGALVLLGIGVRLSIKAVRKYSKVA